MKLFRIILLNDVRSFKIFADRIEWDDKALQLIEDNRVIAGFNMSSVIGWIEEDNGGKEHEERRDEQRRA